MPRWVVRIVVHTLWLGTLGTELKWVGNEMKKRKGVWKAEEREEANPSLDTLDTDDDPKCSQRGLQILLRRRFLRLNHRFP